MSEKEISLVKKLNELSEESLRIIMAGVGMLHARDKIDKEKRPVA